MIGSRTKTVSKNNKSSTDTTKESLAFSFQTSIYIDYLSVEDQIVQTFYQQVADLRRSARASLTVMY